MKNLAANPALTSVAAPARYVARRNPNAPLERPWGVLDTRTDAFVPDEAHPTWAGAHEAAGRINRAFEKAMAP